jgi:Protein of unknown function (DUF1326)
MSSSTTATTNPTTTTAEIPGWYMKADYVETCNCDYGCPCNFTSFPTYGNCRTLVLFHIREGNFGDNVKLDALRLLKQFLGQKLSMKEMVLCNYSLQRRQMKSKDKL